MPAAVSHARALLAGVRAGLDVYRERLMLDAAGPRAAAAVSAAGDIEGFTAPAELALLYAAAALGHAQGTVVEIGSYLGRSTAVLARACADTGLGVVHAVDPHTAALGIEGRPPRDTRRDFLDNMARAGVADHVELHHATSAGAARAWPGERIRLHFVDGWHTREAVLEDVGAWAPYLAPACVVVLDDYMVSDGIRQAVRELQDSGVLRREGLVVGKMAAFGPPEVLARLPSPPGGRLAGRLPDAARERLIRLAAR